MATANPPLSLMAILDMFPLEVEIFHWDFLYQNRSKLPLLDHGCDESWALGDLGGETSLLGSCYMLLWCLW
jgi:hypothetical protein